MTRILVKIATGRQTDEAASSGSDRLVREGLASRLILAVVAVLPVDKVVVDGGAEFQLQSFTEALQKANVHSLAFGDPAIGFEQRPTSTSAVSAIVATEFLLILPRLLTSQDRPLIRNRIEAAICTELADAIIEVSIETSFKGERAEPSVIENG